MEDISRQVGLIRVRSLRESDWYEIHPKLNDWWGGRPVADAFQHLFAIHFQNTSFVLELPLPSVPQSSNQKVDNNTPQYEIVGFLCGFVSASKPGGAYIHFVGVDPRFRKFGLGRRLYALFIDKMRQDYPQVRFIESVTAPVNKTSIGFHKAMGFTLLPGNAVDETDGTPYHKNFDGPGKDRVLFQLQL
jgi:ribosomal protein S18 acetylase RimI-like enzyme